MKDYPLWLNCAVFVVAATMIWWAGTRLEGYADQISRRTGLGQAFTGMLLLAVATSLPEVATTVTAVVFLNNPTLATHNLLGGVALQTAILVAADATMRRRGALTFFSPTFALLIEGVGLLMLLQLTIAGISANGVPVVFSVSVWTVLLLLAYVGVMYLVYRDRGHPRWTPSRADDVPAEARGEREGEAEGEAEGSSDQEGRRGPARVWLLFAGCSLLVLAGGWIATQSADALAEQTGLGDVFVGATLLALATSLPEVSTTVAASRSGRYTAAISNVFGSNAFDVSLLFVADALYREGTILSHAGNSVVFVAAIGAIMTCLYLWGLMERQDRTAFGVVGWDTVAACLVYVGGMAVLYFMK
jgi:cation:H+ antiporter